LCVESGEKADAQGKFTGRQTLQLRSKCRQAGAGRLFDQFIAARPSSRQSASREQASTRACFPATIAHDRAVRDAISCLARIISRLELAWVLGYGPAQ